MRRLTPLLAATALALGAGGARGDSDSDGLPFERTENREDCADFNPLRNPYFGETHIHTSLSFDAVVNGNVTGPADAYAFALGAPITLSPVDLDLDGTADIPARVQRLARPLDFTVVTDHAETFGEVSICTSEELALLPGYDAFECGIMRLGIGTVRPGLVGPLDKGGATFFFGSNYGASIAPVRFESVCGPNDADCEARISLVWQDTQAAAEAFYDRSSACTFTTFHGYEWTASTNAVNLHRNVIFRNDDVPSLPSSYVEEPAIEGLWRTLESQCMDGLPRCDVMTIPHNSNVSLGHMFAPENGSRPDGPFGTPPPATPLTAQDAAFRARMEPLVEVTQHKGQSECKLGVLSNDELCSFESMRRIDLAGVEFRFNPDDTSPYPFFPLAFVRNALKEGLVQEDLLGVNPFRLGMIGSTDGHNGTAGAVDEEDFATFGHLGSQDAGAERLLAVPGQGGRETNPGGLAVVWAEENSRDALFEAMRRREVYATSGTRPVVRFFGSWNLGLGVCNSRNAIEIADRKGVPMGGELPARPGRKKPRFLVSAQQDPGVPGEPGTPLQRIQIVKGWLDESGETREAVYEVAGDPDNGASVDLDTCEPRGSGFASLCTVWEDPDFDADQRAFYYARVIENPTCRWSTFLCNAQKQLVGFDCSDPDSVPAELISCCPDLLPPPVPPATTRFVPPQTIQERAWTSPIWYAPPES